MDYPAYTRSAQLARRQQFYQCMRDLMPELVDESGEGKIPQFRAPYREPVWCLPALYSGDRKSVDLANRIVARYHDGPAIETSDIGARSGKMYNIFQTNNFCALYHDFHDRLTPAAAEVMLWHVRQAVRTFEGSAQPDFVFRGANDNMPALATCGLLLAGQILHDEGAIRHARWNLHQLRAVLARNAWIGEYNSPTYAAGTHWAISKIASAARDEEIRETALGIEHRLWAELILHYHPGTLHHGGPMSRAYPIDSAGHNHSVQLMFWYAFGPEATGRDLIRSYFNPDGREVIHFEGCYAQSAAEFSAFLNTDLHVPDHLLPLVTSRQYPALTRGRSEAHHIHERGGQVQTESYMEENFSLGTVNYGEDMSLYVTYRRRPELRDYRDAAVVFCRYRMDDMPLGLMTPSADGRHQGEKFLPNQGWHYTIQNRRTALMLTSPDLRKAPAVVSTLKLNVVFPAHFGSIRASIIGDGPEREGAVGESAEVAPVSVAAGEIYLHICPLLPTNLPRRAAVRFSRQNGYEVLELVNYEGEPRTFTRLDLGRVLNGLVVTIANVGDYPTLQEFHRQMSEVRVVDYYFVQTRYVEFHRGEHWFRVLETTNPLGVSTEVIDGLPRPNPIFESNQIEASTLPFLGEKTPQNFPFFPWEKMEIKEWRNSWMIGSRGLPGEKPYSRREQSFKEIPDGPASDSFPEKHREDEKRRQLERKLETDGPR